MILTRNFNAEVVWGVGCVVCGLWFVVFGLWFVVWCGVVLCLVCGVWCVVLGDVFWTIFSIKNEAERGQNCPKWNPGRPKSTKMELGRCPGGTLEAQMGQKTAKRGQVRTFS